MNCPAREPIEKKIWKLTFKVPQLCEYEYRIRHLQWWTITYTCIHCHGSHEVWPIHDYELMRRLGLKKCPSKWSSLGLTRERLMEEGCLEPDQPFLEKRWRHAYWEALREEGYSWDVAADLSNSAPLDLATDPKAAAKALDLPKPQPHYPYHKPIS